MVYRNLFNLILAEIIMPRPIEFKDPEYDRQLAEFKAKKAQAKAEQARNGELKKKVSENTWISVKKEQ